MLALAGLAWTDGDNSSLAHSIKSPNHEGQWLHNFDAIVKACGGCLIRNRWEGAKNYNNQTIYFSFAQPSSAQRVS
jgi:hypothetical protein